MLLSHLSNMNYTVIKVCPSDNEEFLQKPCKSSHFIKTDAFTVLPPLSPQIPGPPPTPTPYRILPPIVSKKQSSFVILQEVGSRPVSRDHSPSGRISPFRGCGFKPSSREPSPSRNDEDEESKNNNKLHKSRSRLPVALKKPTARKVSKSMSPVGYKSSGIPRPLNRRISYSPNRSIEVLSDIKINANRSSMIPLRSSENLLNDRSITTDSDLKSVLWKSQKPPIGQKSMKTLKNDVKNVTKKMDSFEKKSGSVVSSPMKLKMVQPTTKHETGKNNNTIRMDRFSSAYTKHGPKSPSKIPSSKSKENLSPNTKDINSAKAIRTVTANSKTSFKGQKMPSGVSKKLQQQSKTISSAKMEEKEILVDTRVNEKESIPSIEEVKASNKEINSEKPRVGKKAFTTSNLLSALKQTKKELEQKKKEENEKVKHEEKKDLPHMDTSKSLPIAIGSTNMTESSVTLIRTTTEPALAPVEPQLVSNIRSAIKDAKNSEELQTMIQKVEYVAVNMVSPLTTQINETNIETKIMTEEMKENRMEVKCIEKCESPMKNLSMVIKSEEPKQEITSTVVKIKQEVTDEEVLSANSLIQNENRNGISKSQWLNEKSETESMKIIEKGNSSAELLVKAAKSSRRNQFRSKCPKCFRKMETYPVEINTITNGSDPAAHPQSHCCVSRYLCCFCHKCRIKKHADFSTNDSGTKSESKLRTFRFKRRFKNFFTGLSCKKNKANEEFSLSKMDSSTACADGVPATKNSCENCKRGFIRCFGILCCLNSAFCLKLRSKCENCCSCCEKCCPCCGVRPKSEVTEAERRKSTSSVPRKRKWTKMLTDFPKLDSSFVEHGSVMRGAIPVLPVPLAWICLILNVFLPGFGTLSSGIFCLCVGKPRFSINDSILSRFGAFLVNLLVAGSQLFTVLFCLVGWGWSIWWGVIMLKMAKKNKRIILAEQGIPPVSHIAPAVSQNHDPERGTR